MTDGEASPSSNGSSKKPLGEFGDVLTFGQPFPNGLEPGASIEQMRVAVLVVPAERVFLQCLGE